MKKALSVLGFVSTAILLGQVAIASDNDRVNEFMTEYVNVFNGADLDKLSTYFNAPFIRVAGNETFVLETRHQVDSFLSSVTKASGLVNGMISDIHSLDSCIIDERQVLVGATFHRKFPNGKIVVRSFTYLLQEVAGKFRIMAMFPALESDARRCTK